MSTPTINQVIDLSHWNTVTDIEKVSLFGIRGIIHKATHGLEGEDSKYAERVGPIRTAGIMHGAYHFGVAADGVAQAKHFLSFVKPDDRTLLALDWEHNPAGGTMTRSQAEAFASYVHEMTGRWPVLYSGNTAKEMLGKDRRSLLGNCPLWLAQYSPRPVIHPTWSRWHFWQYTDRGSVPGIKGNVDRDYFAGSLPDLRELWGYPPFS